MPTGYSLPNPLPWAALAPSLAAAEDGLARLDERLRGSPIREGWVARTHFADSCASLWLDGDLVPLEDLVLHDAYRDIHAPARALIRAQAVLRARRRIAAADPNWALTSAELASLLGRAGEGDTDAEPTPRGDVPDRDGEPGTATAFLATVFCGGRSQWAARGRFRRRRRRPRPHRAKICRKHAAARSPRSAGLRSRLERGGTSGRLARRRREAAALPPVVAAAVALDAWEQIAPLQHHHWLGRLLIPSLLRARGKTKAHLLCLAIGLRAVPRERRRTGDQTARLIAFIDALAAAAESGLKEHDRWAAARAVLVRKLAGRRATSRLPALVDYVMTRPIVSAGMIAEELRITPRAAQNLVADLGLREATGRGRYRAWGII